jgi:GxxExxY protein
MKNEWRRADVTESAVAARYADTTYKIIGSAMKVHNELGPGLKELIYHQALSAEMRERGLSFEDEFPLQVTLRGEQVGLLYLDHFVDGSIVVEEKAFSHLLTNEELAQVLTYLAVSRAPLGLLLNFGRSRLEYKRILPPKSFEEWTERAVRYAWVAPDVPRDAAHTHSASPGNPLIRSLSADDSRSVDRSSLVNKDF